MADDEANRPSTSKGCTTNDNLDKIPTDEKAIAVKNVDGNDSDDDDVVCLSSDDSDVNFLEDSDDVSVVQNPDSKASLLPCLNVSKIQTIAEEGVGLKFLFKNHLMEPLTFLLMLHDFPLELKLTDLIEDSGGIVYKHVNEIDGCTAVLVKDSSLHWSYLGPVFNVSYIQACFESKRILDISKYFKSSVKLKLQNFNFMKVIYFKKYTWETIPEKYLSQNKLPSPFSARTYPGSSRCSHNNNVIVSSDEEDVDDKIKMPPPPPPSSFTKSKNTVDKHTRMLYSRKEDEDILRYVINKEGFDSVKGNMFWKTLEKRNVCPYRTWQSVKERFLKKIVYNLDSFRFLTEEQCHLLQVCALKK